MNEEKEILKLVRSFICKRTSNQTVLLIDTLHKEEEAIETCYSDTLEIYPKVYVTVKGGLITVADRDGKIVTTMRLGADRVPRFGIVDSTDDDRFWDNPRIRTESELILDELFTRVAPPLVGRFIFGIPDLDSGPLLATEYGTTDTPYKIDITRSRDIYISPNFVKDMNDAENYDSHKRDDIRLSMKMMCLATQTMRLAAEIAGVDVPEGLNEFTS